MKKEILSLSKCQVIDRNDNQPKAKNVNLKVNCDEKTFFIQPYTVEKKVILQELIGSKIAREILGEHRVDDVYLMRKNDGNLMCASQKIPDFYNMRIRSDLTGFIKSNYDIGLSDAFLPLKKNNFTNPGFTFSPNGKMVESFEDLFLAEAFVNHRRMHVMNVGIIEPQNSKTIDTAIIDFDSANLKNPKLSTYSGFWKPYEYDLNIVKLIAVADKILSMNMDTFIAQIFKDYFYDNNIFNIERDLKSEEKDIITAFKERYADVAILRDRLAAIQKLIDDPQVNIDHILKKLNISIDQDLFYDILGIKYYSIFDCSVILNRADIFNKFFSTISGMSLGISLARAIELNRTEMLYQMLKKDINIFDLAATILNSTKQQNNWLKKIFDDNAIEISSMTKAGLSVLYSEKYGPQILKSPVIKKYAETYILPSAFKETLEVLMNAAINDKDNVDAIRNLLDHFKDDKIFLSQFTEVAHGKSKEIKSTAHTLDLKQEFDTQFKYKLFTNKQFASKNKLLMPALKKAYEADGKETAAKILQKFLATAMPKEESCKKIKVEAVQKKIMKYLSNNHNPDQGGDGIANFNDDNCLLSIAAKLLGEDSDYIA